MYKNLVAALAAACFFAPLHAQEPAAAQPPTRAAWVYVTPITPTGWTHQHELARQGKDIIFTTSFGYMDSMLKVARQFPDTVFMHCSGFKTAANMGNYFGRIYQPRYLSGMVAGSMSTSGVLGYVAAFPIPEVIRGINAFTLGARSVNPQATVRVVWTKTWYDPAKEKEAAKSLLDVGADVIAQHQDSPGPQEAAQERGVYSIGYNTDMSRFAPDAQIAAVTHRWGDYYTRRVRAVLDGSWTSGNLWGGVREGMIRVEGFGPKVPPAVRPEVLQRQDEMAAGRLAVFAGGTRGVKDNGGRQVIAPGQVLADTEILNMDWAVEGVIGRFKP